jgi:hypothetical protein
MLIPIHNNAGGVGAFVTWAKNGNGTVSAIYKLKSVIRINGDKRKTEVELLVDVAVTAQLQGFDVGVKQS